MRMKTCNVLSWEEARTDASYLRTQADTAEVTVTQMSVSQGLGLNATNPGDSFPTQTLVASRQIHDYKEACYEVFLTLW